ncbi:hypothetical protein QBC36DRAFT_191735 [Triangularia setosa]|uniref:Uncharacterized protein n=1 Tax=Triangularia setosa TaxID=2587417 RepID=A0AAN6W6W9_9PEZI|nr:hypothetical protein QBC36DRAFT_191735 [Podospora setosa]
MDNQATNIFRKFGTKKKRDSMPLPAKHLLPKRTENNAREAPRAVLESVPAASPARTGSVDLNRPLPPVVPSKAQTQPRTTEITLSEPWVTSSSSHPRSASSRNGSSPSPWEEAEMNRLKASHDEEIRDLKMKLGMELEDTRRDMARRTHQLAELTHFHERDQEAIERLKGLVEEGDKTKEELNNLKNNAKQNFQIAEEWKKAHDDLTKEKERSLEDLKEARQQIQTFEGGIKTLESEKEQLTRQLHTMEARAVHERQLHRKQMDSELQRLHDQMEGARERLQADYDKGKRGLIEELHVLKAEQKYQQDKHQAHLQELKDENTMKLGELQQNHQRALDDQRSDFEVQIYRLKEEHDRRMAAYARDRDAQAAVERAQCERQIADLKQVLMEKPGDFDLRLVSDRSLKEEYRALKRSVDTITFNLGPITIDRSIDAASFLEREGKGQERLFVKALIWAMILDGFFSVPYGFGALGPGGTGGPLSELYRSWKKMLEGDGPKDEAGPLGQTEFEPFYRDRYANSWRSATFQSALYTATARDVDGNVVVNTGIGKVVQDNRQRVQNNTLAMLKSVCSNEVSQEIEEELAAAMARASELAIIFGAHRANVCFGIPKRGDAVELGREFVDCQDGDMQRGATVTVELPVLPALFTIGDGKNDLTSVFCVEQGEILPVADT